jgi:hypothetical protein
VLYRGDGLGLGSPTYERRFFELQFPDVPDPFGGRNRPLEP